jgi:hypothetical protein
MAEYPALPALRASRALSRHLGVIMIKANLDDLDMNEVRDHYDERLNASKQLQKLFDGHEIRNL